jgi:hypothetical protein
LKLYVICQRVVILYKLDLFFPVYWKLSTENYSSGDYKFYILLSKLSININNQHKYNLLILVLIFYSLKTILCRWKRGKLSHALAVQRRDRRKKCDDLHK